jgi:hypothetical protein
MSAQLIPRHEPYPQCAGGRDALKIADERAARALADRVKEAPFQVLAVAQFAAAAHDRASNVWLLTRLVAASLGSLWLDDLSPPVPLPVTHPEAHPSTRCCY